MTQYLGIITAYGAVAVLAWLAVLLYPRLIPAAENHVVDHRWREAGFLVLAVAISIGLGMLHGDGLLIPGDNPLIVAANQLLVFIPILAFVATRKSRAALLIPQKNILRSLAIGLALAVFALIAYFSSTAGWDDVPLIVSGLFSGEGVRIAVFNLLRCLTIAAVLALVSSGWSTRTVLVLAGLAIAATQIPSLLADGFSAEWLGVLVTHVVLVVGLISAINATRNIVWFWPVLTALNLLQFIPE